MGLYSHILNYNDKTYSNYSYEQMYNGQIMHAYYSVLCLYPCCVGVFGMCAVMYGEGSSSVSLQLLRGRIWTCMRCSCLYLCWGL